MILYPYHAELRCIRGANRLAVEPVERAVLRELQQRPIEQAAVRWHQEAINRFVAAFGMYRFQLFQGDGLGQRERPGLGTSQFCNVSATTEFFTNILHEGTNIGAFAAIHCQSRSITFEGQQFQARNSNRTRFALHYFASTRQLVQRLAITLEGRVHRRYLTDLPTKIRQDSFDIGATNGHRAFLQNLTFGVRRGGGFAQLRQRLVTLVRIEQVLRELGGFTEAQRQNAGGQRIETAGVTGLLGVQQPADLLQSRVGGEPQRLVEQDDSADITTDTFDLSHRLLLGVFGFCRNRMLIVFSHSALDQCRQMRTAHDAFVVVEVQLRDAAQLHFASQLHTQETGGGIQHLDALSDVFSAVLAHHGDENLGMTDVTADFHSSNGDQADARVFDFATDQLCQLALHLIADTLGTAVFFCHVLLPVTAPR